MGRLVVFVFLGVEDVLFGLEGFGCFGDSLVGSHGLALLVAFLGRGYHVPGFAHDLLLLLLDLVIVRC